ncbi:MAG: hypothetical protein GX175_01780 [Halanaerobiaceae bacterium]|jgi:uncharacterized membrane-anchored protein|nr:hypothetical protein [Halanaerobiaceae bacterium]
MIRGRIIIDKKTKLLAKRIKANEIAVIDHEDIDQLAAKSLVEKQVKAVFNLSASITGKYPNNGPLVLLEKGIPLIDVDIGKSEVSRLLRDGDYIKYIDGDIVYNEVKIGQGHQLTINEVKEKINKAQENMEQELSKFIDNTLAFAQKEKNIIVDLEAPEIGIDFEGKHVLIVARGADYKADLSAIKTYIREMNPIIIAVDGGADACLEYGYQPDIIIGDMDSVSDYALQKTKNIIVHAYPDGNAPGLSRVKELGLDYVLYPAPGTSEDIAMILADDKGAELITVVGSHSNMIDFLEKGRPGMASTLLVRLRIGSKLVDARGVSKLYQSRISSHYWFQFLIAIFIPLLIISLFSPSLKNILQLLALKIKLIFH